MLLGFKRTAVEDRSATASLDRSATYISHKKSFYSSWPERGKGVSGEGIVTKKKQRETRLRLCCRTVFLFCEPRRDCRLPALLCPHPLVAGSRRPRRADMEDIPFLQDVGERVCPSSLCLWFFWSHHPERCPLKHRYQKWFWCLVHLR